MTRELKAAGAGDSHLYRDLKWKLKQANKAQGKQGAVIFRLRNEIAALRESNTFGPGDRARLLAENQELRAEVARLEEKLSTSNEGA